MTREDVTDEKQPPRRERTDYTRAVGIALVALAAAAISCWTLYRLGVRIGLPGPLAALLPVAIDAQAALAARQWLNPAAPSRTRVYARGLVITAVVVSVAGNATEHLLASLALATPLAVIVAVSAIPPIALAATLHLGALTAPRRGTEQAANPSVERSPRRTDERAQPALTNRPTTHRLTDPANTSSVQRERSSRTGTASSGAARERARELFDQAMLEGRAENLTGAALAKEVGAATSTARRWLADWRATHEQSQRRLAVVGESSGGGPR